MNRLAGEKSPYLRQHAGNPVDWFPWGDEAFELARREDKPVFLSIGYSTCHWCHVMERESFADEEAARLLNAAFVCVKVDREERPDLDRYFMTIAQMLTGSGGWPLTLVLTPEGKPFFAGTYFPKRRLWGRQGLMDLVPKIEEAWRERRAEILRSAEEIAGAARSLASGARPGASARPEPGPAILEAAFRDLRDDFDELHGGFGGAPKFPAPHNLSFLLRYGKRARSAEATAMVERTLRAMRRGGIWDQLGFGLHRYSTDAEWRVPHFEKMLYDQALLAEACADAFLATGIEEFRRTAVETLEYVLRDLRAPDGGFFAAEDADSESVEGRFYLWTLAEVEAVLGPDDAGLAASLFGLLAKGNFEEPGRPRDGRNVLYRPRPLSEIAADLGLSEDRLAARAEAIREKLFRAREPRVRPFKDTKILTDWNGLAIGALAKVYRISGDPRHLGAAESSARFILDRMRLPDGRLLHYSIDGEARVPAFLDDYAFLIRGLIELYQAGFDPVFLERGLDIADIARRDFGDAGKGGFFADPEASDLPVRAKEIYDGAIPSGNSVMLMNLLRLARMTGRQDLEAEASRTAAAFAAEIAARPRGHAELLSGLDFAIGPAAEVVVVGREGDSGTKDLIDAFRRGYFPNAVILFRPLGADPAPIAGLAPFTKEMTDLGGRAAAYVCSGGTCLMPVTTAAELVEILSAPRPD